MRKSGWQKLSECMVGNCENKISYYTSILEDPGNSDYKYAEGHIDAYKQMLVMIRALKKDFKLE